MRSDLFPVAIFQVSPVLESLVFQGHAEQFMLMLSKIPCLLERLKLWIFTLDYKTMEKVRSD